MMRKGGVRSMRSVICMLDEEVVSCCFISIGSSLVLASGAALTGQPHKSPLIRENSHCNTILGKIIYSVVLRLFHFKD
jgi:hypothetical protein